MSSGSDIPSTKSVPPETRVADKALVLAILTLVLLTPPVMTIFDVSVSLLGIPLLHIYTFAVWLVAIVLGGIASRRLGRGETGQPQGTGGERGP